MAEELSADAVVVGAGVSGALVAWRLASVGVKVLVLESGPRVDRAEAVTTFQKAPAKTPESAYADVPYAPRPTALDSAGYLVQAGPVKFKSTYERRVGGTTWHWLGTCLRLLPADFALRTRYGVGVDWPLTYDELEPWYSEAERALGVAGDSAEDLGAPRRHPYPMPPIPPTYLDQRVAAAVEPLGLRVRSTPQARNSVTYDGRPACCGSASCIPICPIGAKYDAAVHAVKAEAAGAQILDRAVVHAIDVAPDQRVTGVRFKRPDGSEGRATGGVVVVAAHAIETPKLLLLSRTSRLPNGVANSSDQVGRNLMDHPTQLSWALSREPVYPYRGPLSTSGIEHLRAGDFRRARAAFRIEIGNDGWLWPGGNPIDLAPTLVDQGLRGKALIAALNDQSARHFRLASSIEQLADPDNRVTLAVDRPDALGIPRPRISYRLDPYALAGMAEARRVHERIFGALGATVRHHREEHEGAGHIMGTYRMGANPKTSVVDRNLRSHDHPNLFLLGSGVFPSVGTGNPTLTIAALALRAVDPIARTLAG
jgi:choline dehydrogenase-like flavoprotein